MNLLSPCYSLNFNSSLLFQKVLHFFIIGGRKSLKFLRLSLNKYVLDSNFYFELTEILNFLKIYFEVDYENFILKDEHKQEFKAKVSDFLNDFSKIYNKRKILIRQDYLELFFELLSKFINIEAEIILNKFNEIYSQLKMEILQPSYDYIEPRVFIFENVIKNEDAYKKKSGHYSKYKTIPKWHHYAWDMIK